MKAVKFLLLFLAAIIIGIIVFSYFVWLGYPSKKLNLFILDKSVKDYSYSEHRSLFWVLNNCRIKKNNDQHYNYKSDYYGFLPIPPSSDREYEIKHVSLEQIDSFAAAYDGLYYADTYGVYFNEWFRGFRQGGEGNSLIEGGLNQNDYLLLKAMNNLHKLIICEYNTLDAPTSEYTKFKTQEQLGIQTTGWHGKYFNSLDSSNEAIPRIVVNNYLSGNNNQWPFKKSGIIIMKNTGESIILESGTHLNDDKPYLMVNENNSKKYHIVDHTNYTNWFEIVAANDTVSSIATFQLNVNNAGSALLSSNNLRSNFPAVIVCHNYNLNTYYFAGNFANNNINGFYSRLANSRKIIRKFTTDDGKIFFLDFYFPLMESILNEYISDRKKQ